MKRLWMLGGITVVLAVALMSGAAAASNERAGVFRSPADPWRHWGEPRSFHPGLSRHHLGHGDRAPGRPVWDRPGGHWRHHPYAGPVWVPPFWSWNGVRWILVPGHWAWRAR